MSFEIEFDTFESDKNNLEIEELDEKWQKLAETLLGETPEKREIGLKKLQVFLQKQKYKQT